MTPNAYAHLENNTLRIDVEREKRLQVPLHHLGAMVCFGNVLVSPALMHRMADEGKSVVLLDGSGRFKARLEGPVSGNILLRQAQHRLAVDVGFALEFARTIGNLPAMAVIGFIPAYAGNTGQHHDERHDNPVHPRVRREHQNMHKKLMAEKRFIPAYAGNTPASTTRARCTTVHPRVRGEH